jgi:hypothetical protein
MVHPFVGWGERQPIAATLAPAPNYGENRNPDADAFSRA